MRVAGGFDDFSLRTRSVNQGTARHRGGRDPRVGLAERDGGVRYQTNNGPGDAWLGNRNRGGTPQHGGLSEDQPATLKRWFLSRLLSVRLARVNARTNPLPWSAPAWD